ncbi:DUF6474 family protein [Amycolatopsis methanolica]|uniref:Uncharacterized protein n=1 Tax=Amycolatopsis methanolica 239 TaxID=1068978 RepID=A0A076MMK0_AMYME|nr:DUF6474 family protein [Amycolatopsis methanolica]AIJ20206.1 hypothetical protein AMETH_0114 [Amycolatopsis methanolica 239]
MARKKTKTPAETGITPKKAKNAVAVAKIVVPAVAPALAPLAVKAASAVRDAYDHYQARRLGVPIDQLSEFTGRGAHLLARIAGTSEALAEVRKAERASDDDVRFAKDSQATLEQLTAAVRAAERMPGTRRKAAHQAVAAELERIEGQLLKRLGV